MCNAELPVGDEAVMSNVVAVRSLFLAVDCIVYYSRGECILYAVRIKILLHDRYYSCFA